MFCLRAAGTGRHRICRGGQSDGWDNWSANKGMQISHMLLHHICHNTMTCTRTYIHTYTHSLVPSSIPVAISTYVGSAKLATGSGLRARLTHTHVCAYVMCVQDVSMSHLRDKTHTSTHTTHSSQQQRWVVVCHIQNIVNKLLCP